MSNAVIVTPFVDIETGVVRVLHPQISSASEACISHATSIHANAVKEHPDDVVVAQPASVAIAVAADGADIDGGVTARFVGAERIPSVAEEVCIFAGESARSIVWSPRICVESCCLWHLIHIRADGAFDPSLAVGHGANQIGGCTVDLRRRGGLRDRLW